jgi:tripartite-type tricarboxylate transporter receptor subunit TctC
MNRSKRHALATLGALSAAAVVPATVRAQSAWPSRPVQVVVPFAPGGSNDVIARRLAIQLTKSLGQSVVVENRPGGGSTVGAAHVANAAPDGYTLMFVSGSIATSAAVQKTPYDPVKAFDPITRVAAAPFVILVREDFPAKTVKALIDYAKANPEKVTYGSAGLGDSTQLATELFAGVTGTKYTPVNYKGIAPAQLDLLGGRIDMVITTVASIRGTQVEKLPMLAFTGPKREADYPNVPTLKESGVDLEVDVWWGLFAPAGLPAPIRDRLNREVGAIIADPEFGAFLKTAGAAPAPSTPDALRALVAQDVTRWTETARRAGIRQQ